MNASNAFFLVPGLTREFNAIKQWAFIPEFQLKLFFNFRIGATKK
jgi:hypothetical protein